MEEVLNTNENVTTENKSEKMSYEQLTNIAHQLSEQSRTLYAKLQEANMTNVFKRLDYLFLVLQNNSNFPSDFVIACAEEIQNLLTIPESTEEDDSKASE